MMEISTIALTSLTLYWIRFPILSIPLYFSLGFMCLDLLPFLLANSSVRTDDVHTWVSLVFGLCVMLTAWWIDRRTKNDFAFWGYLFGSLSFWSALSFIDWDFKTEWGHFGYCLINALMVLVGPILNRVVFVIFGTMGIATYLGMLAHRLFGKSPLFPFVLSTIGLGVIVLGIIFQYHAPKIRPVVFRFFRKAA